MLSLLLCMSLIPLQQSVSAQDIGDLMVNSSVETSSNTVIIDPGSVISKKFLGAGFEWDPTDGYDFTEEQWNMNFERIDYMRPPLIRLMLRANFYTMKFEDDEPVYDWNTTEMQRIYTILDYCEENNIKVIIGEWNKPHYDPLNINASDDPMWARLIADFLHQMINVKQYTVLKYYNYINEPNGNWAGAAIEEGNRFAIWKRGIENLYHELNAREELKDKIIIVGPDSTGEDIWVDYTVDSLSHIIGLYDVHRYATDEMVLSGELEQMVRSKRMYIDKYDPNGEEKPYVMAEAGLVTGKIEATDKQPRVYDFDYGVMMTDYAIQTFRGGMSGFIAWMLDDAMHFSPNTTPDQHILKTWGFWNTMGDEGDQKIRPWFYPMSLLSRYFPEGSDIVYASDTGSEDIRVVAAVKDKHISIAIVNQSAKPETLNVVVPGVTVVPKLNQYRYFDNERPVDENDFPVPSQTSWGVNLEQGIDVELPSQGVVFLTSMDGYSINVDKDRNLALSKSATVSSTDFTNYRTANDAIDGKRSTYWQSRRTNTEWIELDLESIQLINRVKIIWDEGYARKYIIQVSEDGDHWSDAFEVTRGNGVIDDIVFEPTNARYVKIFMSTPGTELGYGIQELEVYHVPNAPLTEATPELPYIDDPLNDWNFTASRSGGWTLDTSNPGFFGGDDYRARRWENTTEHIVYNLDNINKFSATIYYSNEFEEQVAFYSSTDEETWHELPTLQSSPEPTMNGWFETIYSNVDAIPEGTNFLMVEFKGGFEPWTPQLGHIQINDIPEASSNKLLTDLKVDGVSITNFAPINYDYQVYLPYLTTDIPQLTAIASDANSTVSIQGPDSLNGIARIVVTAEDESTQEYSVEFILEEEPEHFIDELSDFTKTYDYEAGVPNLTIETGDEWSNFGGDLDRAKRWNTDVRTALVYNHGSIRNFQATLYAETPLSEVQDVVTYYTSHNGTDWKTKEVTYEASSTSEDWTRYIARSAEPLELGTQFLKIEFLEGIGDPWTPQVGQVIMNQSERYDATLTDLRVDDLTVTGFVYNQLNYHVQLPSPTFTLPAITAETSHAEAEIEITYPELLPGTVYVHVTGEDGSKLTYSISFTTVLSTNASLSDLRVNGQTIPSFSSTETEYHIVLPYGTVKTPDISFVKDDPNSNVSMSLPSILPGTAEVSVIAEDGNSTKTYYIHFSIASLSAADIASWFTFLDPPSKDASILLLPELPEGYSIAIKESSHPGVIALDGGITRPKSDTTVQLILEVTKIADGSKAETGLIEVTLLADNDSGGHVDFPRGGQNNTVPTSTDDDLITIHNETVLVSMREDQDVVNVPLSRLTEQTLEVSRGKASIRINKDLWEQLTSQLTSDQDSTLTVEIRELNDDLSQGLANVRQASPVFGVTVKLNNGAGELIIARNVSGHMIMTLPYEAGTDHELLGIYYFNDLNGELEYVGGVADPTLGTVTTGLGHLSKYVVMEYNKSFEDLPKAHWAARNVQRLVAKHVITGTTDLTFEPEREITRAEFVTMLTRALGLHPSGEKNVFKDVDPGSWYADSIIAAVEADLIIGVGNGQFAPNRKMNRSEMAVVISRALQLQSIHDDISLNFSDHHEIPTWAKGYIAVAYENGIIQGKENNRFDPLVHSTRAEAATVILRMMQHLNK